MYSVFASIPERAKQGNLSPRMFLLGWDWLLTITLDCKQLNRVHHDRHRALLDVIDQYAGLFKPKLECSWAPLSRYTSSWILALDFFAPDPSHTPVETMSLPNSTDSARPMLSSQFRFLIGQHPSFWHSRAMDPWGYVETTSRFWTNKPSLTSTHCWKWMISWHQLPEVSRLPIRSCSCLQTVSSGWGVEQADDYQHPSGTLSLQEASF